MIVTTRQAVNALDIFHRAVAEIMIERGLIQIIDDLPEGNPSYRGAIRRRPAKGRFDGGKGNASSPREAGTRGC